MRGMEERCSPSSVGEVGRSGELLGKTEGSFSETLGVSPSGSLISLS